MSESAPSPLSISDAPPIPSTTMSNTASSNTSKSRSNSCPSTSHEQKYVDHSYTDYANVRDDNFINVGSFPGSGSADDAAMRLMSTYRTGRNGSDVMPFPSRLHKVLERSDLTAVIDWMPHGRAFIVKQPNLLTTLVLSRFFKQTKYLSFTRQLNLWGFKRITRGIDSGSYYHERFLPGRPHLTMGMKRVKIKGTARIRPNPKGEPNFYYDYPPVYRGVVRPHKVGLATPLPANQRSTCVSAVGSFQPHTSAGMGHDMEARNSLAMGAAQFGLLHATGSSSGLTLSPEVRAALAAADTSRLCGSSLLRKDPARARPIAHHPPLSAAAAVEYRLQETVLGSMSNHARTTI